MKEASGVLTDCQPAGWGSFSDGIMINLRLDGQDPRFRSPRLLTSMVDHAFLIIDHRNIVCFDSPFQPELGQRCLRREAFGLPKAIQGAFAVGLLATKSGTPNICCDGEQQWPEIAAQSFLLRRKSELAHDSIRV